MLHPGPPVVSRRQERRTASLGRAPPGGNGVDPAGPKEGCG
jgi:hypothetical protein